MTLDTAKFTAIVETAKQKASNDPKWLRAIEKAAAAILSGEMIVTTLRNGALVTTANGTYAANGHCNCEAARHGHKECRHRAAARLMDIYETEMASAVSLEVDVYCSCCGAPSKAEYAEAAGGCLRIPISLARDTCPNCGTEGEWMTEQEFFEEEVATTSRKNLIIEICAAWPSTWPPLYTELLARFGCSDLSMLDDDQLRRIRLAIAM